MKRVVVEHGVDEGRRGRGWGRKRLRAWSTTEERSSATSPPDDVPKQFHRTSKRRLDESLNGLQRGSMLARGITEESQSEQPGEKRRTGQQRGPTCSEFCSTERRQRSAAREKDP